MRKFGKGYNVKMLLVIMAMGFFMTNAAYPESSSLRVQVGTGETDTRFNDAIELQLDRKEKIIRTFQMFQQLALGIEGIIEGSSFLEKKDSIVKWIEGENKTEERGHELAEDIFKEYKGQIEPTLNKKIKSSFKDEYESIKYFVDLNGAGYFDFRISYDLQDKFGKPFTPLAYLFGDEEVEVLEEKFKEFIEKIDIYLHLLEDIKSPTRDVLDVAQEMSESEGQPEYSYRFLSYYYLTIVENQTIELQPVTLQDKLIEIVKLIAEDVSIEKEGDEIGVQVAKVFRAVLKDDLQIILDLEKENILTKAKDVQGRIRTIEDKIKTLLNSEVIDQTLKNTLESEDTTLVKYSIESTNGEILKNLRILRTILVEIKPVSIKGYIEAVANTESNLTNL